MHDKRKMMTGWFCRCLRQTFALGLIWTLIGMRSVSADTYTWSASTTGAASDGSGAWNTTAANWVGSGDAHTVWNNANGDTAAFGAGGTAGTVTVDSGGVTVGGLLFNAGVTGAYTLSGGPLTLTGSPVFQADTNATMNVLMTGTAGFTKTGAGSLTFSRNDSTFTGDVTFASGSAICTSGNTYGTNSVLGRVDVARTVTVQDGAVLQFNAHNMFGDDSKNPVLTVTAANGGQIRNQNAFTVFGPLNLIGSSMISSGGANTSYQAYHVKGRVTSGGNSAISTTGGNYNGIHIHDNTFAVTGGTLTVSAPLINKTGGASTGFTKTGNGTMILAADNTFSGNVTVSNSLLQVGNGGSAGTLGTGAGTVTLVGADATLVFDRSGSTGVSGAISGDGALIKKGSGLVTLSGANTYAGGTLVSNGVLAATTTNALPGYAAAGKVTLSSGAGLSVGVGSWPVSEINALIATGVYGNDTFFGFDTTAGNYTYSGQFTLPSVSGIVKTGPYVLTLSSSTGCAGGVTALGGILQADFGTGLPATTNLTLAGASLSSAGGSIMASLGTGAGEINLLSGTASGFSAVNVPLTVNIGGSGSSLSWGDAAFNPGALLLNDTGANTNLTFVNGLNLNGATRIVTVNATGTGAAATIGGVIADGSAAAGLAKSGAGTLKLSAANTYSGGTTVSAGTLALEGGDNRLNTAGSITLNGGTLDLGGNTQTMTAGTFAMANGTTLQNGTINYRNTSWSPGTLASVTFGIGGRFVSPNRLLMNGGQTLTLAAGASLSAFGGNGSDASILIGVDNVTTNTLVVNGGCLNFTNATDGAGYLRLAANGGSGTLPYGMLTVNGGTVNVGHSMNMGARYDNGSSAAYGVATFTLNNGVVNLGTGCSTNTINGNRGWCYLGNGNASTVSKSTVNLNGGTLSLVQLEGGPYGTNTVNFNGGTLKARADGTLINGSMLACNIDMGGAVIDTAGFNVGVSANMSGIGSLTKQGEGSLVLSGSNTVSGKVSVEAGTLTLSPLSKFCLKLHLDASDVSTLFQNSDGSGAVTASGQQVGYWSDTSGNGKPALQSISDRRPTYVEGADGFNGRPVIQFDGSNDDMTSLLDINPANLPNTTIVIVYKQLPESGNGGLWGHDNGGWDRMQLFCNGGTYYQVATAGAAASVKGMETNKVTIYTAVLQNGVANGSYVYINGQANSTTGYPAFTSTDFGGLASFTLANISPGNGFQGCVQIGEVLVYNTALGDAARRNVEAYLKNKWEGTSESQVPVLHTGTGAQATASMFPGVRLWLDASSQSALFTNSTGVGSVTTSGQPVGYWGDLSGNNKPATQSTLSRRPIYVTHVDAFNGQPVIQFDGADDDITSALNFNAASLPNVTVMMVYRQVAKTANAGLWGHDDGGWDRMQLLNLASQGVTDCYGVSASNGWTTVKGLNTNAVVIYAAVLRQGVQNGSSVFVNGVADDSNGLAAFTSFEGGGQSSFTLADIGPGNGLYGNIQVGEVLIFDTALDDTARGNVESYLRSKWLGQTATNSVTLAAGTVLDLDGAAQELASVAGDGTISNGTLTVSMPLSPGGDGVIGTLRVANAALNGTLRIDVAADGTCDQVIASGAFSLSGLTLQIADTGLLNRNKAYTVVTCSGTLSGLFVSTNLPGNWRIRYDYTAGEAVFYYAAPGTVFSIK